MISSADAMRSGFPKSRSHGCTKPGNPQIGDRESGESGLAARSASGGPFVADLASGSGGRPRKGGDAGGVVVGFHLQHDVHRPLTGDVAAGAGFAHQPLPLCALDDRGVVAIGREHPAGALLPGAPNHVEEGAVAGPSLQGPRRVEYLVAAVLGVDLGEHHQLGVVRIAPEAGECVEQVVESPIRRERAPPSGLPLPVPGVLRIRCRSR